MVGFRISEFWGTVRARDLRCMASGLVGLGYGVEVARLSLDNCAEKWG